MNAESTLLANLLAWPARRAAAALVLAAAVSLVALIGVLRFRPEVSLESLFPRDNRAAAAMVRVLQNFRVVDDLLILVSTPDGQTTEPGRLLDYADRLSASLVASPQASALADAAVYRLDDESRAFFERVLVPSAIYYLDDNEWSAARARMTREEMVRQIHQDEAMIAVPGPQAAALSAALLQDPLRLHEFLMPQLNARRPFKTAGNSDAFFSPDQRSLLIRVPGKQSLSDLEFAKRITAIVGQLAREANTQGLRIDLSGGYAIASASERAIRSDMISSIVGSVVLLQVLFVVAYHKPARSFLLAFFPVAVGILWGFGLRAAYSTALSPPAAVVGGILAGVGIDYTIQYLSHYQMRRATGLATVDAAVATSRTMAPILFAAWATSVIGFLIVGTSSIASLRDFAIVGSLGLTGALVSTFWLLPALLSLVDRAGKPVRIRFDLAPVLVAIARRRRLCLGAIGSIVLVAASIVLAPGRRGDRLPLDPDMTIMHPRPNPPLDAEATIARRMGISPGSLMVHLRAKSFDDLLGLAVRVDKQLKTPQSQAVGVVGTFGVATLLPDPAVVAARQQAVTPADAYAIVADFRAAVADSEFRPEMYEPYAQFLSHLLSNPRPPTIADLLPYPGLAGSILGRTTSSDPFNECEALTLVFLDRSLDDRDQRSAAVSAIRQALSSCGQGGDDATLTGLGVIALDTDATIRRDLPRMLGASMVLVGLFLIAHFRKGRDVLWALGPTLISLLCLWAAMRVFGQKLNVMNLLAVPLLMGIDTDYGIFLVGLARSPRSEDQASATGKLAASFHALSVSAASAVLGFGALMFTSVPAIRSLGWAVGVGVAICWGVTMLLRVPLSMAAASREHPLEASVR